MNKIFRIERVREFIKVNKLNVKGFCKQCGISMGSYYKFANDNTDIDIRVLYRIARFMKVEMKDLVY